MPPGKTLAVGPSPFLHDGDGNGNVKKQQQVHVHHAFFIHFSPVIARVQRETSSVTYYRGRKHSTTTLMCSLKIKPQKNTPFTFDQSNQLK